MAGPTQRTVTLSKRFIDLVEDIANKEDRTISNIVRLLIEESFGNKAESKKANEILTALREKYGGLNI